MLIKIHMFLNFTKKIISFLCIIVIPQFSSAEIEIVFFQHRDTNGNILSPETNGRFYHSAIKTDKGWLQAAPYSGVIIEKNLNKMTSKIAVIIKNDKLPVLTVKDYGPYLEIPFDFEYRWENPNQTYCSKLIANLLNIQPLPIKNSKVFSQTNKITINDTIGLSPDDLYNILTTSGGFDIQEWKCRAVF
jgi:hypothetical protein